MKISKKNLMAFVKNHAYGEEVLGKRLQDASYNEVWYNNRSFHIV